MRGAISLEFMQVFAAMMLIAAMMFGFYTATAGQLMGYSSKMFGSAAISKLVKDVNFVCTYPYSERIVDLQIRNAKVELSSEPANLKLVVNEEKYSTYCPANFLSHQLKDGKLIVGGDAKLKVKTSMEAEDEVLIEEI